MLPRALLCALAVSACDAAAKPAEPSPAPVVAPAPSPVVGAPYHRTGDRGRQVDALTFWGWSRDGRYFAFETAYAGPGAAACEGQIDLFVVDADTDTIARDGHLEVHHADPDGEPCDPPDLQATMDAARPALLRRYGVEPGHLRAPIEPRPAAASDGKRYTLALPSGRVVEATLSVRHGGRDVAHEGGASFTLELAAAGGPPLLVEPGQRRRPFVWDYALGPLFVSPDGGHAALLVRTTRLSFEGDRTSAMATSFVVPAGW